MTESAKLTEGCSFCGVSQQTAGLIRGEAGSSTSYLCEACLGTAQRLLSSKFGATGAIVEARTLVIDGVALVWSAYMANACSEQPSILINIRREDQNRDEGVGGVLPGIVVPNDDHARNTALAFAEKLGLKPDAR